MSLRVFLIKSMYHTFRDNTATQIDVSINQSINQREFIIAPKSIKVVQRRSRQLDEINVDALVGRENI